MLSDQPYIQDLMAIAVSICQSGMSRLFKLRCLDFDIEAVNQIEVRFPFDDPIIRYLEILDPAKVSAFQYITQLSSLFPKVAKQDEIQQLGTEW
ncbi:hypothetical protein PR048_001584 [Dryococelus australis]|uniref:Uncharacterized protein n=1 Tax=Dryococelus australis TaxID=614101 RepID=A0ABQ9IIT5_9NEOP|nr:hypothetical protein PR048_001584 [Dryococelus australis]